MPRPDVTLQDLTSALPPLRLLMRMQATINASVEETLRNASQPLACKEGCGQCCCQPIPATLLEIMGLKLYLHHLCSTETLAHLCNAIPSDNCFFLSAQGSCLAYTFRPIACRRFLVGTQACQPGENPTQTRPEHILEPNRSVFLDTLRLSGPFYVESGLLNTAPYSIDDFKKVTVLLASIGWREEIEAWIEERKRR